MPLGMKRPVAMGKTADGTPVPAAYIGYIAPRVPGQIRKRESLTGAQQVNKVIDPTFIRVGQKASRRRLFVQRQKEDPSMKLVQFVKTFVREEDGAAAIEYGLIAALIAVAIIVGATLLGTQLDGLFTRLGNCMANPAGGCAGVAG